MERIHLEDGLHIRPARDGDQNFFHDLYAETRKDLSDTIDNKEVLHEIIDLQFRAQSHSYSTQYPNAYYFVVEKHGEKIGRATLDFSDDDVHLVDLALVQKARGKGIGKAVIRGIMSCAEKIGAPMRLAVFHNNVQAKAIYTNLGFVRYSTIPPYEYWIWHPAALRHRDIVRSANL